MNRIQLAALTAALTSACLLAGCSRPQPAANDAATAPAGATPEAPTATAATAVPATQDVFRFKVGTLDAVALEDGDIDAANDGKTFAVGQAPADVAALLTAAGQPTDMLHLSIQPLLVRSGAQVLLFDTGAGDVSWARAGRLQASLRAAGVEPAQVTDIFLSHQHQDHTGGLLARDGTLAFANAAIHVSAAEWASLKGDGDAAALVAAMTPKVVTFQPGATVIPGVVTAVDVAGHTPGHSAYEIQSGSERLLYIGDAAHHFVISVQRPDWTVQYDQDAPRAQASRRALLQRAADGNLRVYSVHFPFPGLGHFKAQGDSFVWVPEH
ncbi:MBL fold metallo-hydrolase [Lysobacter sp. S4-A87]|uniref:MBL fold metallo-hydrolase n=1 Tax=Lysobacter sp. S4-A87 TaxID=2925843 RepID=UPI001F535DA0|nr:MBL fold metallo-hydrolase [Lysobacter sp. S4-A87]UNK48948.1 MBL fold metallo-hydrolase [Lysobacter sp. S4-A87]